MSTAMVTSKTEKNHGKLIIISGPAGSGKGTILKELLNFMEYKYSVSATTRNPRAGEISGVDYYFFSKEEFLNKISNGDMLEYVEYSGNYYGTLRTHVEKMLNEKHNVILEIEVVGALNIKERFPEAVMIFITPPTYAELEQRLRNRKTETEEIVNKRLEISKKEVLSIEKYGYLVINECNMQKNAAFNIHCIIESERYADTDISKEKEIEAIFKIAENNKINQEKAELFLKKYFA